LLMTWMSQTVATPFVKPMLALPKAALASSSTKPCPIPKLKSETVVELRVMPPFKGAGLTSVMLPLMKSAELNGVEALRSKGSPVYDQISMA